MKVLFNAQYGKLFDFLLAIGYCRETGHLLDSLKSRNVAHYRETAEAFHSIWEGLDLDTPGLGTLIERKSGGDWFLLRHFVPYIWKWESVDVFIENFDRLIRSDLRYDLLSFYDAEEHTRQYYDLIMESTASLHDFVYQLQEPDRVKVELIGIASGAEIYASSLKALFKTVAERLDLMYQKNRVLLEDMAKKMRHHLDTSEEFLLMQTSEFKEAYNKNRYEAARVSMSFLNPLIIFHIRNEQYADVFLGMENPYQQSYENGSIARYELFFKALSDDSRIRIIELLREREMYIGEISQKLNIPLTTLSYHVRMLNEAEIINLRFEGKKTYCIFAPDQFGSAAYALKSISGTPRSI